MQMTQDTQREHQGKVDSAVRVSAWATDGARRTPPTRTAASAFNLSIQRRGASRAGRNVAVSAKHITSRC